MFKKERGITLVALVVTIVVLLILAGVSISMVLGNNGVVTKAKESKEVVESALKSVQIDVLTGTKTTATVADVVTAIGDSKFTAGSGANTITYTSGSSTYTVTVELTDYTVTTVEAAK